MPRPFGEECEQSAEARGAEADESINKVLINAVQIFIPNALTYVNN